MVEKQNAVRIEVIAYGRSTDLERWLRTRAKPRNLKGSKTSKNLKGHLRDSSSLGGSFSAPGRLNLSVLTVGGHQPVHQIKIDRFFHVPAIRPDKFQRVCNQPLPEVTILLI